jgi:hypothetical protein
MAGQPPVKHGGLSLAGPCLAGQAAHLTVVHSNKQVSALRGFSHGCLFGSADTQCGQCLLRTPATIRTESTGSMQLRVGLRFRCTCFAQRGVQLPCRGYTLSRASCWVGRRALSLHRQAAWCLQASSPAPQGPHRPHAHRRCQLLPHSTCACRQRAVPPKRPQRAPQRPSPPTPSTAGAWSIARAVRGPHAPRPAGGAPSGLCALPGGPGAFCGRAGGGRARRSAHGGKGLLWGLVWRGPFLARSGCRLAAVARLQRCQQPARALRACRPAPAAQTLSGSWGALGRLQRPCKHAAHGADSPCWQSQGWHAVTFLACNRHAKGACMSAE